MTIRADDMLAFALFAQKHTLLSPKDLVLAAHAAGIAIPNVLLTGVGNEKAASSGPEVGGSGRTLYKWGSVAAKALAEKMGIADAMAASGVPGSGKYKGALEHSYVKADVEAWAARGHGRGGMSSVPPKATPRAKQEVTDARVTWAAIVATGVQPTGVGEGWLLADVKEAIKIIAAAGGVGSGFGSGFVPVIGEEDLSLYD